MNFIKFICYTTALVFSLNHIHAQHAMLYESHKGCCKPNISYKGIQSQSPLLHHYDVKFYHLDVAVERTSIDIEGHVHIMSEVVSPVLDTFVCELIPELTIDSVLIDGANSSFFRTGDEVFVVLGTALPQGTLFTVTIYYGGTPQSSGFFSGISNDSSPSWGNQITWTLSEPFNAKQWFPVKQVLGDKADSVYVFITTDASNKAGSNGILTGIDTLPQNKVKYKWKSRYPIAYYLISIAVGEYIDYSFYAHPSQINDSILIQNFIYNNPGTLPFFKTQIDLTKDFMELFSDLYGIYPFWEEKYGHCMAPLSGGMEHQTMSTQGFFNFTLTSHELGHQWFGNSVTCATWSDIWINEGFASYSEYLALEHLDSGAEAAWLNNVHNSVKSLPGGSVYVPPAQANNEMRIFDSRLSYRKGASILHMIRFELQNDSLFFNVLQTFLNVFKDSVATGDDFKEVLNQLSGKNFGVFFDQWYYGEGFPSYDIVWAQHTDTLYISSIQSTSTSVTPLFSMLLPFQLTTPQGDTTIFLTQSQNDTLFKIPFTAIVSALALDPDKWLLMNVNGITQSMAENASPVRDYSLYPNPAGSYIHIQFCANKSRLVQISDISGKVVKEWATDNTLGTINIENLPQGMYFIRVNSDNEQYTSKRFIKY